MIHPLMIRTSLLVHLTVWLLSPPVSAEETVFVAGDVAKPRTRPAD